MTMKKSFSQSTKERTSNLKAGRRKRTKTEPELQIKTNEIRINSKINQPLG
jgi:hypothetical protein